MLKRTTKLIHGLRLYLLLFILIIFLYQLGLNPVDLGRFIGAKLGSAVGMSVSVPPNPINKLALELRDREDELDNREQALNQRELDLASRPGLKSDLLTQFILVGIITLFILILLNYYLDYKRRKKSASKNQS
jgi:hypothetical protein